MNLRVLEIFDSFQGEGHWSGTPMTFVRLAGCNAAESGLECARWCDTPESWHLDGGRKLVVRDVILKVRLPRLCITGGEPLLQRDGVSRLAAEARGLGMKVHVETNGTLPPPSPGRGSPDERVFDWATVSPKPPDYVISRGWDGMVDELKLIVDGDLEATTAESAAADHPEAVVCIQPVWGETRATKKAMLVVMEHPEWRLSLQTHKFLGIK